MKDKAQDLAGALLDAEVRIGELLKNIKPEGNNLTSSGGRKVTLPEGITHKQSHFFQTMASNPEIVEQIKAPVIHNA